MGNTTSLTQSSDVTNLLTSAMTASMAATTNNSVQSNTIDFTNCDNITISDFTQSNTSSFSSTALTSQSAQQSSNQSMLQTIVNQASAQGLIVQAGTTAADIIQNVQTAITNNMTSDTYTNISTSISQTNALTANNCKNANIVNMTQSNQASAMNQIMTQNTSVQAVVSEITQNFKNTSSATTTSHVWLIVCVGLIAAAIITVAALWFTVKSEEYLMWIALALVVLGVPAVGIALGIWYFLYKRQEKASAQWSTPSCKTNTDCSTYTLTMTDGTKIATSCQSGFCQPIECVNSACSSGLTCYNASPGTALSTTTSPTSNPGYCAIPPTPAPAPAPTQSQ